MVDFDALEAAGIANARERAALIEYLDGLGFTADEMVAAERQGRLFGLSGDAMQQSGPPIFSLRTAADELGVPVEDVARVWAVSRLDGCRSRANRFEPGRRRCVDRVGDLEIKHSAMTPHCGFAPRYGRSDGTNRPKPVPRCFALDSQNSTYCIRRTSSQRRRAYRDAGDLIAQIGKIVAAAYVHHALGVRTHVESVMRDTSASVACGVGFADLSGFTALTQRLTPAELSLLLGEFNAVVTDVVHAHGGRVVKFIGDEVMWVSSTPERLVRTAADLVDHPGPISVFDMHRVGR